MCTAEVSQAKDLNKPDSWMAGYSADWESVARYSVYRSEFVYGRGIVRTTRHSNRTYSEAKALQKEIDKEIQQEPGYVANTMSRPMVDIELENHEETFVAFKKLRAEREAKAAA